MLVILMIFPAEVRSQTAAARLVAAARAQLDSLNADSAEVLLRRALSPGTDATLAERVRGYVLLGVSELIGGRELSARLAFREALRYYPELRVDSLAQLHSDLLTVFNAEKAALPPGTRPAVPSYLEFRGLPRGAQIIVDGVEWRGARGEVAPGMHRFVVGKNGYEEFHDSVAVDVGAGTIREVRPLRLTGRRVEMTIGPDFINIPKQLDTVLGRVNGLTVPGLALHLSVRISRSVYLRATYAFGGVGAPGEADFSTLAVVITGQARTAAYALLGPCLVQYRVGVPGTNWQHLNGYGVQAGLGVRRQLGARFAASAEALLWGNAVRGHSVAQGPISFSGGLGFSYVLVAGGRAASTGH